MSVRAFLRVGFFRILWQPPLWRQCTLLRCWVLKVQAWRQSNAERDCDRLTTPYDFLRKSILTVVPRTSTMFQWAMTLAVAMGCDYFPDVYTWYSCTSLLSGNALHLWDFLLPSRRTVHSTQQRQQQIQPCPSRLFIIRKRYGWCDQDVRQRKQTNAMHTSKCTWDSLVCAVRNYSVFNKFNPFTTTDSSIESFRILVVDSTTHTLFCARLYIYYLERYHSRYVLALGWTLKCPSIFPNNVSSFYVYPACCVW